MMTSQERIDSMIDCINELYNLGLEPTGFKMNSNLLERLLSDMHEEIFVPDNMGIVNTKRDMLKYKYEIMGIPIEPKFGENEIKVIKRIKGGF